MYICTFEFVCIYLCMYIYISIHTYILEQGRWLDLKQGAKSLWKSAPKKCADVEQNLNLKEVRQQPSPMISYGDCQVHITRPFGCPLLTCVSSCDASKAWSMGPAAFLPRSQEKKDHGLWSHMVPEVMRNGPGYTSTKDSWSQRDNVVYWKTKRKINDDLQCN